MNKYFNVKNIFIAIAIIVVVALVIALKSCGA